MPTLFDHFAVRFPPPVRRAWAEESILDVRCYSVPVNSSVVPVARGMPWRMMYPTNNRPSKMVHSNPSHWVPKLRMEKNDHLNSPSSTTPPLLQAMGQTAGRTTISEKKKVLDEISYEIEQIKKDIKSLNEALRPEPPGFARIIASICAVLMVMVQIALLVAMPILECFIYIGVPCFFEIICFEVFSSMYPPMFCVEGWQQFGALIVRCMCLAMARFRWFYSWLTMKD